MGTNWQMPLAVIGKPTGDGRQFDSGALTHRKLPLPLRYVASDSGGHSNAVIVGHISQVGEEKNGMLPAKGEFYDDDTWPDDVRHAAKAARMFTANKVIGPSVDLDQMEAEHVPEPKAYAAWKKEQVGKLKAAKKEHANASGSDCGCGADPVMAEEAYDGPRLRVVKQGRFASATLVHIPAFAELAGHAKLTNITPDPAAEVTASGEVDEVVDTFGWDDVQWTKIENEAEMTDQEARDTMVALMAGAAPAAPPKAWFDDPKLTGPTALHISDDGRVFGHVAVWDTCHVGIGDSCVKPPKSLTSYAYFHTGEVVTDDGGRVPVGRLTYGGGHAAPNLGFRAAAEHYDRTSNMGALVRAGEDQFGIWVSGAVVPEADEKALRVMRSTPLSGDWRRVGGNLEMVAALHVNTAGFPIPRMLTASGITTGLVEEEEVMSLTAAGCLPRVVDEDDMPTVTAAAQIDPDELGRAIARGMRAEEADARDRAIRAAEWRELVAAATVEDRQPDYDDAMSDLMAALVQE